MKYWIIILIIVLSDTQVVKAKVTVPKDVLASTELLMKIDIGIDSNWYPEVMPFPLIEKFIKFYEIYSYADSCSKLMINEFIGNFEFYAFYFDSIRIEKGFKLKFPELNNYNWSNNIPFIIAIDWRIGKPYRVMGFRSNDVIALVNNMYSLYNSKHNNDLSFKNYLKKINIENVDIKGIYLNYSHQKKINCFMGLFSIYDLLGYGSFMDNRY